MNNESYRKFRAWDGKKMWPYAVPLLFAAHNGGTINVSERPDGAFNQFINGILIQSTGLKDKNGLEIYEGDILKSGVLFIVQWGVSGGWEKRCVLNNNVRDVGDFFENEIVGNIYENPNLIGDNNA